MRIEKREAPRTLMKIQINYECDGAYLYDYARDMSEGGIFIQTDAPLETGREIKLKFILPEVLEEVEVKGTVKWVNPPGCSELPQGMGVCFSDLPEEMRRHINDVREKVESGKGVASIE